MANNINSIMNDYFKKRISQYAKLKKDKVYERNGKIYVFFHRGNNKYDDKPYIYDSWEDAADFGFNII